MIELTIKGRPFLEKLLAHTNLRYQAKTERYSPQKGNELIITDRSGSCYAIH